MSLFLIFRCQECRGWSSQNSFDQVFSESDSLILIMTSRTERDFREQARALENVEFFEKPLSPRKLVNRLDEYFEGMESVA